MVNSGRCGKFTVLKCVPGRWVGGGGEGRKGQLAFAPLCPRPPPPEHVGYWSHRSLCSCFSSDFYRGELLPCSAPLSDHEPKLNPLLLPQRYYAALDAPPPERAALVHALYLPTSRITWNGNPLPYADLPAFVERLPKSSHEIQAFDCHPIAGEGTLQHVPSIRRWPS